MLTKLIVGLVRASCRFAWLVILAGIVLTGLAVEYTRNNFAINTDSSQLIASKLPWRQRELAFDKAFPQRADLIIAVLDGPTPEAAELAAGKLAARLRVEPKLFQVVAITAQT